jgi:hypothetical protein
MAARLLTIAFVAAQCAAEAEGPAALRRDSAVLSLGRRLQLISTCGSAESDGTLVLVSAECAPTVSAVLVVSCAPFAVSALAVLASSLFLRHRAAGMPGRLLSVSSAAVR